MTRSTQLLILLLSAMLFSTGCGGNGQPPQSSVSADPSALVGAWRSKISFRTGPLAEMKDLEFLYVYNSGGTMTESSNYDEAANSSPPAYGVWKQVDQRTFVTKYLFFTTQAPGPGEGAPKGNDWWPAGHGVLTETITLSEHGKTYASAIKLTIYDRTGAPVADSNDVEGTGAASRIVF